MEFLNLGLENGYRLLLLAIPAVLGALVGRSGLLGDNERAIDSLNVYALYIGFPALVFAGVIDDSFTLPTNPWFWLIVPIAHGASVLLAYISGEGRGTLALTALFGNVAYLGLPLVVGIYGAQVAGVAALIVAIHVAISVSVGPLLLRRWGGDGGTFEIAKVLKLPLLWAPFVGLAARSLPINVVEHLETATKPIASSAAPVALFLLGLYIWTRRDVVAGEVRGAALHVAMRLFAVPVCTIGVVLPAVAFGNLDPTYARLFVVLSSMPAAITTFSIAHDAGIGQRVVAATIVRTSLIAIVWLPVTATAVELIF